MPTGGGARINHLIERYRLVGMGEDLESRWIQTTSDAKADPQEALTALTNYFNTTIILTVLVRIGADPSDHSPEKVNQILTEDNSPTVDETAVRSWLDEHGIDPGNLAADFVSTRAMHRYLRKERGLEVPLRLHHPPEVAKLHDITVEDLKSHIESASDQRDVDRLQFIRQLYKGTNVPDAAEAVGYEPSTGYRWLAAWEAGGVDGLLTDHKPGYQKLTPQEERRFVTRLAATDRWATDDIDEFLTGAFEVTYSDRHLRRKLEGYGLEKVPQTDVYCWPDEAPDEASARRTAALDKAGLLTMSINDASDTTG